jgi:hypothetical protein
MKVLARKYVVNNDKTNEWFDSIDDGIKYLKQTEDKIRLRVEWLCYTDIFFKDTNDYLRIKHYTI